MPCPAYNPSRTKRNKPNEVVLVTIKRPITTTATTMETVIAMVEAHVETEFDTGIDELLGNSVRDLKEPFKVA